MAAASLDFNFDGSAVDNFNRMAQPKTDRRLMPLDSEPHSVLFAASFSAQMPD
jgi:hypothetical protein